MRLSYHFALVVARAVISQSPPTPAPSPSPAPPFDPSVPFSSSRASVSLDGLRGSAALLVAIGHLRSAFFVNLGELTSHKALWFGVYALTSLGHQAVIVFFVLSGYLVGGSVIRALRNEEWSWSRYFTHRLVRLWLVLLPALLLGLAWDQAGLHSHAAPLVYSGQGWNHTDRDVADTATAGVLLANLAFRSRSIFRPSARMRHCGVSRTSGGTTCCFLCSPVRSCCGARGAARF